MPTGPDLEVSVIIPTYGRNKVLTETIASLLGQKDSKREILIVDQTRTHETVTQSILHEWSDTGAIVWVKCERPSVTAAMNIGLQKARGRIVLFLDDDIEPDSDLIASHLEGHRQGDYMVVAGRVIQPWDQNERTPFFSTCSKQVDEFMGGNFSVNRKYAISLGGFDQNFRFAAYQFERDFADRVRADGGRILYWPSAVINHLKTEKGGVRSYGDHHTTWRPGHSLGAYYYIQKSGSGRLKKIVQRLSTSIVTRFHLTHPWYVPVTLVAEISGLILAGILWRRGPQLITQHIEI
ncbi:MAG: glycosyltransferase family 2 protein [bacterium]